MIVGTSAIMAIVLAEPEGDAFTNAIFRAVAVAMSAATFVELTAVLTNHRSAVKNAADALIQGAGIVLEPLTATQAAIASAAYRRFGKGTGHSAKLNFCDCFSYALAQDFHRPLLFKGEDFGQTDVMLWRG